MEALKVWDRHQGKVDLLLTDIVMPEGLNGKELAAELRKRKPGLKVVYTSGYSADIVGRDSTLGDTAFLAKPYAAPRVAEVVRRALDATARQRAVPAPG